MPDSISEGAPATEPARRGHRLTTRSESATGRGTPNKRKTYRT